MANSISLLALVAASAYAQLDNPAFSMTTAMTTDAIIAAGGVLDADTPDEAAGSVEMDFDGRLLQLNWICNYESLSSNVTSAYWYGPADETTTGEEQITISDVYFETRIDGFEAVSLIQNEDLLTGMWYVQVNTELNPDGEIRGQILPDVEFSVDEDTEAEDSGAASAAVSVATLALAAVCALANH